MARVSFTLRKLGEVSDNQGGSYLQLTEAEYEAHAAAQGGTWEQDFSARDFDSGLRADGYAVAPNRLGTGFVEITPVSYSTATLSYGVPIELDAEGAPVIGVTPAPYEAVVVYNRFRYPVSLEDGRIVSRAFTRTKVDVEDLPEGEWAYFTLFVRYRSNADDYTLPYANLEILVPKNYGSTLLLYERLPIHYREQDQLIGLPASDTGMLVLPTGQEVDVVDIGVYPIGGVYGPLFRFLSVFGYEMDKARTLLDYLMVSHDPLLANTSSLDALALMLQFPVNTNDMNGLRIRRMLMSMSDLYRSKGSLQGFHDLVYTIGDTTAVIDQVNHTIDVHAQRVNFCYETSTGRDGESNEPTYRPAHEVEQYLPITLAGVYDPLNYPGTLPSAGTEYAPGQYWAASAGTLNSYSVNEGEPILVHGDDLDQFDVRPPYFADGARYSSADFTVVDSFPLEIPLTFTWDGTAGDPVTHMWIRLPSPIPVKLGDEVFVTVGSSDRLRALRLSNGVGGTNVYGEGTYVKNDDVTVANARVTDIATEDTFDIVFAEVLVDLSDRQTFVLEDILIERNRIGTFFNGDSTTGSWVLGEDGITLARDYRFSTVGTPSASSPTTGPGISIYTEQTDKTRELLNIYFNDFFPLGEYTKYSGNVTYNAVPGQTEIDAYYLTV